jgi:nitrogen fixation protein FixH
MHGFRTVIVFCMLAAAAPSFAQTGTATLVLSTMPTPLGVGQNRFDVVVTDARKQPVTDAEVTLLMVMPADPKTKHPEMRSEGKLHNIGKGHYNGVALVSMAGAWDVTVTATRKGQQIGRKTERLTAHLTRPKPAAPAK